MNSDIKRECIKARAYGKTDDEIINVMGVDPEELAEITDEEVQEKREYLKEMGYI